MTKTLLFATSRHTGDWLAGLRDRVTRQGRDGVRIELLEELALTDLDAYRDAVGKADAVVADFNPVDRTRDAAPAVAPDPDVVTVAALARYADPGKPVALLAPPGASLPFDWASLRPIEISRETRDRREVLGSHAADILTSIHSDFTTGCFAPPEERLPANRVSPAEVFLAMPFQGYHSPLPDGVAAYDFTRTYTAAKAAVEEAGRALNAPLKLTIVKPAGAHNIWHRILQLLSRASAVIVDLSPDVRSGLNPNPNALTEATIARAVYGHEATMVLCQQSVVPHRELVPGSDGRPRLPSWQQINRLTYDPLAADDTALTEGIATALTEELQGALPTPEPDAPPPPEPEPVSETEVGSAPSSSSLLLNAPAGAVEIGDPQGDVKIVDKMIHVPAGETLTIPPGGVWFFQPGAGLDVEGTPIAKGAIGKPIRLTGDPHDWEGVRLRGEQASADLYQLIIEHAHPTTRQDGGGLAILNGATVTAARLTVQNCRATQHGGGVFAWGRAGAIASLAARRSRLAYNRAEASGGGANFNDFSEVEFQGCTITTNTAEVGGGILTGGRESRSTTLTARDCKLDGNRAEGNGGGANFNNFSEVELQGCTITTNTAGKFGGGISTIGRESRPTVVTRRGGAVRNNTAPNGPDSHVFPHSRIDIVE
jgi:hypothetical protein